MAYLLQRIFIYSQDITDIKSNREKAKYLFIKEKERRGEKKKRK